MTPFQATWRPDIEAGVLVPLRRYHNLLAAEFGGGEVVTLERREERSSASHAHFFACVQSAWDSLPEDMAERWSTPEHLRRWALIKSGHRDERTFVCANKAEAQRLMAFMRPMDEYAVIVVRESVVTVYVAKSQSMRAMDRTTFGQSKNDVLGVLAELIGVTPEELARGDRAPSEPPGASSASGATSGPETPASRPLVDPKLNSAVAAYVGRLEGATNTTKLESIRAANAKLLAALAEADPERAEAVDATFNRLHMHLSADHPEPSR